MSQETKSSPDEAKSREVPVYHCDLCGEDIRTNAYFVHVRQCAKRPKGPTISLYPIPLPQEQHRKFKAWCSGQGLSLAEGVRALIAREVR